MAGRITAPYSAARFMLSSTVSESGVSRGTRISLPPLLQVDLGRAVDQVGAGAVDDRAERAAGARADHHAVGEERAAGDRAQVVAVVVVDAACLPRPSRRPARCSHRWKCPPWRAGSAACGPSAWSRCPASASTGEKLSRSTVRSSSCLSTVWAAGLMTRWTSQPAAWQDFQQPHGIDDAAGPGDGDDDVSLHDERPQLAGRSLVSHVQRGDPQGKAMILDPRQPGRPHPRGQVFALRELADAGRKIIVSRLMIRANACPIRGSTRWKYQR